MANEFLVFDHVTKRFGALTAVNDVSIAIKKGEFFSLLGPSGCGKTTLLRMLGGFERPDSGRIYLDGKDITEAPPNMRRVHTVFQNYALFPTMSIWDNIAFSLRLARKPKAQVEEAVDAILKMIQMGDHAWKYPNQLSGGQKQRVGIARALATSPDILLCDEATSALDPQTTESILRLLQRVNREMGVTILLITHQMQVIQLICNKVAVMEYGRIVEEGSVLSVFGTPKEDMTRRFVRTVINDQIPEKFISVVRNETRNQQVELLKFIGDSVKEPLIANLCRMEGLEVNILGATIQEMQGSVMSVFILQLIGEDALIAQAEDKIDQAGALRERMVFQA